MDNNNYSRTEDEEHGEDLSSSQLKAKRNENISKQNSEKNSRRRLDSAGNSNRKNKDTVTFFENRKEQPELWKVVGRKERRRADREAIGNKNRKGNKEGTGLRKPLKTLAVVITIEDRSVSYSEVLAWARQTVNLSEEEINAINTKRSATGGILLEIKGDKNKEIAERLTESLRITLKKYQNVRVHRPRQMAEFTLVGLDVSVSRNEVKTAIAREEGCSFTFDTFG